MAATGEQRDQALLLETHVCIIPSNSSSHISTEIESTQALIMLELQYAYLAKTK